jgi:hypothetical protein
VTDRPNWHTSTYTKSDTCVEVADNDPSVVKVRDTKDRDAGTLHFPLTAWMGFVESTKR